MSDQRRPDEVVVVLKRQANIDSTGRHPMERPHTLPVLRFLRITVTALSLTACVLLIALWVRSYRCHDGVWGRFSDAQGFHLSSHEGRVQLAMMPNMGIVQWRIVYGEPIDRAGQPSYFPAFEFPRSSFGLYFAVPHWALVASTTIVAALVAKRRFSLRTLLIATTLVAVALGVVMNGE